MMQVTLGTYHTTPAIRAAVNAVLDSDRLSYGPVSREYERRFAAMHGCAYGVASNSGTSSLQIALQALKEMYLWQDGDEVIVPALTFVATVNAVLHNRLTPVLVDVNPLTFNIDTSEIEAAITKRTRCILPVHLFGLPADMAMIRGLAVLHNLRIVEDSCEAMLTQAHLWSDVACFSTYAAHLLVTGVGGMATTNNPDLALVMRSLVNHGIDLDEMPTGEGYDPTWLARKFRFNRIGHSFRVTELEAAIGLAQLDDLPAMITKRRQNAEYLFDRLPDQVCTQWMNPDHSWMVFPLVLERGSKWPLMAHLQAAGIECREMMPLTCQPCYAFREIDYPVAKRINEGGCYVGIHQDLTIEHLNYMADVIAEYFK